MRSIKHLSPILAAMALLALPALAQAKDADSDGLPDRWEQRHHVASANADPDADNVDNRNEFREGTRPRDRDSNNNGRPDGREDRDHDKLRNAAEDKTGNDPVDPDSDNDGIADGYEQAGVVTAYDEATGSLTIDLANGGSVTGLVTEDTDVECLTEPAAEEPQGAAGASGPGGPGGGERRPFEGRQPLAEGEPGLHGHCDDKRTGNSDECPEGTLAVGARVHEAALLVSSAGAEWVEIEILTEAAAE